MHPVRCILLSTLCLLTGTASARGAEISCGSARPEPAIISTTLANTPALLRVPGTITQSPIVLWHGFGPPASERALMDALPLDDVPARKVYLGLPMFGERSLAGGMDELAQRQREDLATLVFEPAVMGAAKELSAVLKALERYQCVERGESIGVFGFSAGGAAALYALAEADVPIAVAVTLNASTGLSASIGAYERATKDSYGWTDTTRALARGSDAVTRAKDIAKGNPPPALLIIHGADDAMLTPQIATSLRDALQPLYQAAKAEQRLQLSVVPGMAHAWTGAEDLATLRSSIGAWFHSYLPSRASSKETRSDAKSG
jgi:dienelactone hydrolase